MTAADLIKELEACANAEHAAHLQRFFKTGKGEYGEGDVFLGLHRPQVNTLVKRVASEIELFEIEKLFQSPYHEARTLALSLLVWKYQHAKKDEALRQKIVEVYLANRASLNNWDLVDISVYKILGARVYETGDSSILFRLSKEHSLWSQRMSVVACMYLIKKDDFRDFKQIAAGFLTHKRDLMHKAVGWMLREMGKRNEAELLAFLDQYAAVMPRTMLRYSLEKLSSEQRRYYMDMKK